MVVVRGVSDGMRMLLLRAYRNWDFPKGGVEAGEDALAAAIRETAEETQIEDLEFRWGHDFIETGPYSGNKIARYYIALTQTSRIVLPINPELGRPEHHEYRWADASMAIALAAPRVRPVVAWAADKLNGAVGLS